MAHLAHVLHYDAKWFQAHCPALLSEEDSLRHVLDHAMLVDDIQEDLGVDEAEAVRICAAMGLDKARPSDI